jgi:hypothetical protein
LQVVAPVRRHRDILLIDQRGTRLSHALKCRAGVSSIDTPVAAPSAIIVWMLRVKRRAERELAALDAARRQLEDE